MGLQLGPELSPQLCKVRRLTRRAGREVQVEFATVPLQRVCHRLERRDADASGNQNRRPLI